MNGERITELIVAQRHTLPDPIRLERYGKLPSLGPRVLLFGGGTALRDVCRRLIDYTHNSIHLVTPFDSGGSSAALRDSFDMIAVGDIRSRLMSLADQTVMGQPEIFALFSYRLPRDSSNEELRARLRSMVEGEDEMIAAIDDPMRKIIRSHLRFFAKEMPGDFDLRGANIGNLILVGGYLNQNRHLDPVIYLFSRLVEVKGIVRTTASEDLHLACELEDGELLVGQHRITGKQEPPISKPIRRLYLARREAPTREVKLKVRSKISSLLRRADLICYPMGSFYSSLIANFLPHGVGQAILETDVPKVYFPNTGNDPEQLGLDLRSQIETMLFFLHGSSDEPGPPDRYIQFVFLDRRADRFSCEDIRAVEEMGIRVLNVDLEDAGGSGAIDPEKMVHLLVSMV